MKRIHITIILVITLFFTNCQSNPNKHKNNEVTVSVDQTSQETLKLADFELQIPEGWSQEQPSSQMRVAQLAQVSNPETKIAVFYFGQQDMVEANIKRWKEQFTSVDDYQDLGVSVKDVKAIKILGTFKKKAFPMAQEFTEQPDYGTLAAIVSSSEGPYYFKLSAPRTIIEEQEANFIAMLNSR